ncbi:hypothetical protein [Treponema phagedenis]|uniref:YxeA family protein n=1 Tax=Treponema phagedenis TaxID=162 RepID=A0A0B7GZI2_TREPH|nr:hypothetical protein [Treponema phagedenis]NVP25053.1 hypothetical protein [Treponema phagedenis]QEJ94035.1 hypothetical protein FUT79_01590 [Treponema phagedenis]QEJ97167.1 hypothetical protein FUT82_03645 [Treponema phagedenis]QEK01957.1 hypothetical protein FUT84_12825 [Treponema phagedenis]QEK02643.1 hypothetical protein FUT83_01695 [Treponema phagedenis]
MKTKKLFLVLFFALFALAAGVAENVAAKIAVYDYDENKLFEITDKKRYTSAATLTHLKVQYHYILTLQGDNGKTERVDLIVYKNYPHVTIIMLERSGTCIPQNELVELLHHPENFANIQNKSLKL